MTFNINVVRYLMRKQVTSSIECERGVPLGATMTTLSGHKRGALGSSWPNAEEIRGASKAPSPCPPAARNWCISGKSVATTEGSRCILAAVANAVCQHSPMPCAQGLLKPPSYCTSALALHLCQFGCTGKVVVRTHCARLVMLMVRILVGHAKKMSF